MSRRFAELRVAAQFELAHRLFVPVEADLLEHAAEPEAGDVVPAGRAVEHQHRVGASPLAQVAAELRILLRIAPRVQLERGEAGVDAFLDVAFVLVHRVPRHRRGVDGDFVAVAAEHFVERHVGLAALDVPGDQVDQAEMMQVHLLDPIDLPGRCQRCSVSSGSWPMRFLNRRRTRLSTASPRSMLTQPVMPSSVSMRRMAPCGAVRRRSVARSRQARAPAERDQRVLVRNDVAANVGDLHFQPPAACYEYCMRYAVNVTWRGSIR